MLHGKFRGQNICLDLSQTSFNHLNGNTTTEILQKGKKSYLQRFKSEFERKSSIAADTKIGNSKSRTTLFYYTEREKL